MLRKSYGPRLAVLLLATVTMAPVFAGPVHTATVIETMDSGGYTYVKVDEDGQVYWAAAPAAPISVGDRASFTEQMNMVNFTSSTLNRTFDRLMFVSGLSGGTATAGLKAPTPSDMAPVEKAEGGYTIAEVFAHKDELKGKTVKVRGRVVKVSRNIMGLNWVHLEDGSGEEGTSHLVFRSPVGIADLGSVVTAEGIVDTDKDFGYGYTYEVLVNDATFSP